MRSQLLYVFWLRNFLVSSGISEMCPKLFLWFSAGRKRELQQSNKTQKKGKHFRMKHFCLWAHFSPSWPSFPSNSLYGKIYEHVRCICLTNSHCFGKRAERIFLDRTIFGTISRRCRFCRLSTLSTDTELWQILSSIPKFNTFFPVSTIPMSTRFDMFSVCFGWTIKQSKIQTIEKCHHAAQQRSTVQRRPFVLLSLAIKCGQNWAARAIIKSHLQSAACQ